MWVTSFCWSYKYIFLQLFSSLSSPEPAVFQKKLKDSIVILGKSVCLDCIYSGTPEIKVHWKKNGLDIVQSEKHIITTTETSCILEILNTIRDDGATYMCEVENDAGTDTCHAEVNILGLFPFNFF